MTRRVVLVSVWAAVAPAGAFAQGLAIDHKEVRCIVAGKFPRFDACFNPSGDVARARVYFRAEGGPHWYFVDMKTSAPCFTTVLPKPKKSLKKMNYYLEVVNRGFEESRTTEYNPDIVTDQGQCRKDVPAAPFVQSASVTVGVAAGAPAIPAGFAASGLVGAGISTTAVVAGVVGGGAAVAGGAIIVGNSSSSTTAPAATSPTAVTTPTITTPTPVTTPGPTLPPSVTLNQPPIGDFRINPDPPKGIAPFLFKFNLCGSRDPDGDTLRFTYDYGDGARDQGSCRSEHTYTSFFTLAGRTLAGAPVAPPSPTYTASFNATACVDDRTGQEGHKICQSYTVDVDPNCGSDTQAPSVSLTSPANGSTYGDFGLPLPVPFRVSARDNVGIQYVEYLDQPFYGPSVVLGSSTTPGNGFAFDYAPSSRCSSVQAVAKAVDVCGNATFSAAINVNMSVGGCGSPAPLSARKIVWVSQLDVAGGRGQVILNGRSVSFPGAGRAHGMGDAARGANRIEAILAEGRGEGGLWQFDLGESEIEAGSLTVVAGEVAELKPQAITFRLKGQAGERVVFTFRPRP